CPGLSWPDCSAASITPRAKRSLTDPKGLKASIFTKRFTPAGASLFIFTEGVLPTVSRIFWNFAMDQPRRWVSERPCDRLVIYDEPAGFERGNEECGPYRFAFVLMRREPI